MYEIAVRRARAAGLLATLVLGGSMWLPGALVQASQAVFRSGTDQVVLFATVRGSDGRLIADLQQDAFEVFDDGVRAPIAVFSNAIQPITAVVLADTSGSMGMSEHPRLQAALRLFVRDLRPEDRLRIGSFGDEIALGFALTGDRAVLERTIAEELWIGGTSPVWRAIDAGMTSLEDEPGRTVVVVMTDGVDYSPGGTVGLPALPGGFGALRRRAEASGRLLLYAIGFGDPKRGQQLRGDIVDLVRVTGGGHVDLSPTRDLGQILVEVGEELRRQYIIGFAPRFRDGKTHPVKLRIAVDGATVRARSTYLAPVAERSR